METNGHDCMKHYHLVLIYPSNNINGKYEIQGEECKEYGGEIFVSIRLLFNHKTKHK